MDFGILTIVIFVGLLGVAIYFCCRVKKTPGHVFSRDDANQAATVSVGATPGSQIIMQATSYPNQRFTVGTYPVSPNGTQMPYPAYNPNGLILQNNRPPYPVAGAGGMPLPNPVTQQERLTQSPSHSPYFDPTGGNAPSAPPAIDDLPPPYESVVSQKYPL